MKTRALHNDIKGININYLTEIFRGFQCIYLIVVIRTENNVLIFSIAQKLHENTCI
jgi:hypothetical protein